MVVGSLRAPSVLIKNISLTSSLIELSRTAKNNSNWDVFYPTDLEGCAPTICSLQSIQPGVIYSTWKNTLIRLIIRLRPEHWDHVLEYLRRLEFRKKKTNLIVYYNFSFTDQSWSEKPYCAPQLLLAIWSLPRQDQPREEAGTYNRDNLQPALAKIGWKIIIMIISNQLKHRKGRESCFIIDHQHYAA